MKKNIAVIGCGHWGKNLIRNFDDLGVLAAVCDPDSDLAQFYVNEYNVRNSSFTSIISNDEIEGIVLAVPAPLHASMAIDAMNAGKNVFVEKPLAMNEDEAQNMIDSAKKNSVQLMVGHLLQYHPVFMAVRKIVKSGELGSLKYIYSNRLSFGKIRTEEDVIWSFAPHDISMILSLTGHEPQTVRTESSCILQPNIADIATIHMEFNSGLKGHISVSWLHPFKEQKLVVIGEDGMVVFDDTKEWNEKLGLYKHSIKFSSNIPSIEKAELEYLKVSQSEPLSNECKHFLEIIRGTVAPLTNADEGLRVLRVLSASSSDRKNNKGLRP